MAVNDVYQATAVYTSPLVDGDIVNVIHYRLTTLATPKTEDLLCLEIAVEIKDTYVNELNPSLPTDLTLDRVDCFNVDQPTFSNSTLSGDAGDVIGDALPPRNAPVISKKTGLRGRSFRGRMYLPFLSELQQNGGVITPAALVNIQDFADDLIVETAPSSNQWELTVYSAKLGSDALVTSMVPRSEMGSVRGRKKVSS